MKGRGLCAVAAGFLALGACATVGPDYATPQGAAINAMAAQGAFLGAGSAAVAQADPPADWWRLYRDPLLDSLEREALAANTDLRVAAANLARAQAVLAEARAASDPSVQFSGSTAHAQESGEAFLLGERLPIENLADVGARISYQIDLVGRLRRASEAARADTEVTRAGLDLARISVAADVASAYVDACAAGEELVAAQRTIDLQTRNLASTQRLTEAGRGIALDVTRAQAELSQSRAAAPPLIARRQAALFRLATLTGHPPAELPRAVSDCQAPPKLDQPIPVGDGAALLKRRPDVREAERGLAAATARIGVATAALYPTVSIGVGAGSTGLLATSASRPPTAGALGR